jgi:methylmalonyl-CoA mutase, N-terminal domain
VRAKRDDARVSATLSRLADASRTYVAANSARTPMMELIVDAVRARASVGEIADTMRDTWGTYRPA